MLVGCGVVDVVAMVYAAFAGTVLGLGVAVVVSGATWTGVPAGPAGLHDRGGTPVPPGPRAVRRSAPRTAVGLMVGPLIGAGLIAWQGIGAVFLLGAAMSAASALLALAMPDLGADSRREQAAAGHVSVLSVLLDHRRTLLTLGTAVIVIGASRSIRNTLLPLWADHIGMSPASTSLLFACRRRGRHRCSSCPAAG